jgi:hypothetical protein
VEQEPADELVDSESHRAGFVGIGGAVLFELKRHLTIVDIPYPAVVDGHAVRIAAEVFQYPVSAAEGRLTVDDPFDTSERCGQREESGGFPECLDLSGEAEEIIPESVFESFEEEPPEEAGQHPDRQKEAGFGGDPAGTVEADAATGYDPVNMGMKQQILSPVVQDREKTDVRTEMARIGGNGLKRCGAGGEQDFIQQPLVSQNEVVELFRDGENHMVIIDRQQFSLPAFHPLRPGQVLAFRTMTVTAGVAGVSFFGAVAAFLPMAPERGGTTRFDGLHQSELMKRQVMLFAIPGAVGAEDVGHLEGGPGQAD